MADRMTHGPRRLAWLDRLRGLAVVLMLLDHALYLNPEAHRAFLPGRLALPLFMACAGTVYRGMPSRRRRTQLYLVLVVDLLLAPIIGLGQPAPVTGFVLLLVLLQLAPTMLRWPATFAALGFLQGWFLPVGWRGWEIGVLLGWFMLGRLAGTELEAIGGRLPAGLAWVGRRPLSWYVAHLVVLALLVGAGVTW